MKLGKVKDSEFMRLLLYGTPIGYPIGHPVDGPAQIPILTKVDIEDLPAELIAFNDLGRSISPSDGAVHFYKSDIKFAGVLRNPKPFGFKAKDFQAILTPDVTIGRGMPEWMRMKNTVLSRMCGVIWQRQGVTVIPSLRWVELSDLQFVTAGIETGSVISVSSYGSVRNKDAKHTFEMGLEKIVDIIQPQAVIIYGSLDQRLARVLKCKTELRTYPTAAFRTSIVKFESTGREEVLF